MVHQILIKKTVHKSIEFFTNGLTNAVISEELNSDPDDE